MLDPEEFGKAMASIVKDATAPLLKRIEELEARQPEKGEKGDPGADAPPVEIDVADVVKQLLATDALAQIVGLEVAAHLEENPPAPGMDGERGPQGEKGLDGKDGEAGKDGAGIADLLIDRDGNLVATMTDGRTKSLGVVIGRDGKDGEPGKDGRSVEGLTRTYSPETHEIIERWNGDQELRYPAGGIHHKGYWNPGVKAVAGDSWTHNGNLWIAVRDTGAEPSTECKDWTIGARKGRDGRDGKDGKPPPGPVKL